MYTLKTHQCHSQIYILEKGRPVSTKRPVQECNGQKEPQTGNLNIYQQENR